MKQAFEKQTSMHEVDGAQIAIHAWVPALVDAVVFYIHGTQSHGGWLFETGPVLAERGVAVYAADRRGSGESSGARGDVSSFGQWLDDYSSALTYVIGLHAGAPLTLLGQSLGGLMLAGLLRRGESRHDAAIFCAPALRQSEALPEAKHRALAALRRACEADASQGDIRLSVPLKDEWYTTEPRYLAMLRDDALMLRALTVRANIARFDLDAYCDAAQGPWHKTPTLFVAPRNDKVIDLAVARRALAAGAGDDVVSVEFPVDDHFLEFSPSRDAYLQLVAHYARTAGLRP